MQSPLLSKTLAFGLLAALANSALVNSAPANSASADDYDADRIVLESGKELRGRVLTPYAPLEVTILHQDRTVDVRREDIASMSFLGDRLDAWLAKRQPNLPVDRQWSLVDQAANAGLPAMARLQAYYVLTLDPDFARAHEFLEHRGQAGDWEWRFEDKFVRPERFAELSRDGTHPLTLDSEHWRLTCDAGLETTLATLFDLERLYVEFGKQLGSWVNPSEGVEPMEFRVFAREQDMPVHSSVLRHSYYDPGDLLGSTLGSSSHTVTHLELGQARPVRLFDLATQQVLYETVLGFSLREAEEDTSNYRVCASLEIGLGHWLAHTLGGAFGFAHPVSAPLDPKLKQLAKYGLESGLDTDQPLSRLPLYSYGRYQIEERGNELVWALTRAFVAYLMDPATNLNGTQGRAAVRCLCDALYVQKLGNSSSRWDDCLGLRIEETKAGFSAWL